MKDLPEVPKENLMPQDKRHPSWDDLWERHGAFMPIRWMTLEEILAIYGKPPQ